MTEPVQLAMFGVTETDARHVLDRLNVRDVDYADLYFESRVAESVSMEEGIVKRAVKSISQGVGVRATAGEKTGFAYSDDLTKKDLELAADTARYIADSPKGTRMVPVPIHQRPSHDLYPVERTKAEVATPERVALLNEIDAEARRYDPRIKNVMASFNTEYKVVVVATSDGALVADVQPLSRLQISCIAEEDGNRQIGSFGGGGRVGFEFYRDRNRHLEYAREAAREAIVNLSAVEAPAGVMPVVLAGGWPGILLHEAIGHGLEADFNRKKTSAFSNLIGKRVASEVCTIVDDGTLPFRRGSLNMDDEGTPTGRTILIEKGILRGYLTDKLNARLMGIALTGNGRRESYQSVVLPRMTNTFMLAGESDPQDIIRSVKRGLYAVSFGGGQVDITNGKFVFSASEAYLIEDGKVTRPVKGATLIGNGPEILKKVSMVGHDLKLDNGIGTCGKDGQSVPVGVGLPTIKVDEITVGGTQR
ncbi:metalloprotease TldD [Candidatus Nitrospira inopinata]|jgi:TldD protein|uniref:Putative peptidase n=1 Tax=Candidatus Nitrospira inopinata TaxID=1715989 RepID=A0A0S4KUH2_9BACT|nr:metalloprotease TldD [Candidatus Nitrospira inopinata]CUQ66957.1 putative peptidase [Candidatus Nitrospira inopinata]